MQLVDSIRSIKALKRIYSFPFAALDLQVIDCAILMLQVGDVLSSWVGGCPGNSLDYL